MSLLQKLLVYRLYYDRAEFEPWSYNSHMMIEITSSVQCQDGVSGRITLMNRSNLDALHITIFTEYDSRLVSR